MEGTSGLSSDVDVSWYLRGSTFLGSLADSCLGILEGHIKKGVCVRTRTRMRMRQCCMWEGELYL